MTVLQKRIEIQLMMTTHWLNLKMKYKVGKYIQKKVFKMEEHQHGDLDQSVHSNMHSQLFHLASRIDTLECSIDSSCGTQLDTANRPVRDLTSRINDLSVHFRALPDDMKLGELNSKIFGLDCAPGDLYDIREDVVHAYLLSRCRLHHDNFNFF
jgi:hypothetical protein